jgi:O-acetylserine/cysteine efflux transporter
VTAATRFSGRDYAAALVVVLIWGTNFVVMKVGLRDLTPFQLGVGRFLFAAMPLMLVVRPPKLRWHWFVVYGLCQGVGQFGLLFLSLRIGMSASLASVLLQTQVFFTAMFGMLLLGEKVTRAIMGGLLLAALGLACFGMDYIVPGHSNGSTTPLGFLLAVMAASMWAASNIVVRLAQRSTPQFDVLPFMVWSSAVSVVPFVLLTLAFDPPATRWHWITAPWTMWASLAYLGWMGTLLGYSLWTRLLKRHAANRVAPFSLAVPVIGVSTGMLVLGDAISGWQWIGIALIVGSLAAVIFGNRPAKP